VVNESLEMFNSSESPVVSFRKRYYSCELWVNFAVERLFLVC